MSAPPYMQLYVADYLGDTRHLTTEQHGAYLLLLMAMWRAGGSLPDEPSKLARMVGMTARAWGKISADVLEFFTLADGRFTQKRITEELKKAQRVSEARSEAGARGAEAKALKTKEPVEAIAVDLPKPSLSSAEAYQISDIRKSKGEAKASLVPRTKPADVSVWDDVFAAAWEAYPKSGRERSMSRAKTWPLWREAAQQAGCPEKLLASVRRYTADDKTHKGDCGAPAFDRWLKSGRWEHFLSGTASPRMTPVFPDLEIRQAVISAKGEAWAASWLDPCSWEPESRVIVPRNGLAAQRLRSEVFPVIQARKATIGEMVA